MSKHVECSVEDCMVPFKGKLIKGVRVTCSQCGHEEKCGGRHVRSAKRALIKLRENCPDGELNIYVRDRDLPPETQI